MRFHPAAQILAWCFLVGILQMLALKALLVAGSSILLVSFALSRMKLVQLLRRTRWIMLSLMLIYAYSTPGQPLSDALGIFGPSREGLLDGVLQLARLLAALAGLAILLDRLHRQQLISGLYVLFAPLQWLGLSRERCAVRLALTLHYAEVAMLRAQTWQSVLHGLTEPHAESGKEMELPIYRFTVADALLLAAATVMLWMAVR
ncbi:MAG TPA: hypothetical protein VFW53_08395 [Gallionella sp.]|nr:hypothetical protein [Gallionella sp.]